MTVGSRPAFGDVPFGLGSASGCNRVVERDGVSESFELVDEALGGLFGVAAGEVIAAEVVVELAGAEHVPDRDDDRVLDRAEGFLVPAAGSESGVLGGEVGVFAAGRGQGGFFECPVKPFGAVAGLPGAAFAGGLVVAWALPGPRRELFGRGEDAHVDADLGDDAFGGAPLNAGDRAQQLNGLLERGDLLRDHLG